MLIAFETFTTLNMNDIAVSKEFWIQQNGK